MAREFFIYWKLDLAQTEAAVVTTAAMQAALVATWPGLHCRLYRRVDVRNGQVTLMEIYARAPGVDDTLEAAIAAAAAQHLQDWAAAPRHVEVFEALDR